MITDIELLDIVLLEGSHISQITLEYSMAKIFKKGISCTEHELVFDFSV